MNVLLLGANGQLGWELQRTRPQDISMDTCDYPKVDFLSTTSVTTCIETARPDWIINAAAYTAVDKAEEEKDIAERINHTAVRKIAELCRQNNIRLIQISTDFVFNGKAHRPCLPQEPPDPISTYGKTKLQGEQAVLEILKDEALIIRTAWLYSSHGGNFVKSMLNFFQTKPVLNIIDEQIGTPTWAQGLAHAVWKAMDKKITGIHHFTDAGIASWYDFAIAIQEEALSLNLIQKETPIHPIPASQYPTPARRPFYGVLDKTSLWKALDITPVHWRKQLRSMLQEMK